MSKRAKISIDAFGEWQCHGAAAEARHSNNSRCSSLEEPTLERSAIKLPTRLDCAYSFGFHSSDPDLDDRNVHHAVDAHGDDTESAAETDVDDFPQNQSCPNYFASARPQQKGFEPTMAINHHDTKSAKESYNISSSKRHDEHNTSSASAAKQKEPKSSTADQTDSSAARTVAPAAVIKVATPGKKVHRMLKDLYPHNDGPSISIPPSIGLQTPPQHSDEEERHVRLTRTLVKDHYKRTRDKSGHMRNPQQGVDIEVSLGWARWQDRKDRLNKLSETAHVLSKHGKRTIFQRGLDRVPRDADFFIDEAGAYTFTPTAEQYSSFSLLLTRMEECVGLVQGVVKVMVPIACISPYKENTSLPNILVDLKVPMFNTTLSQCLSAKRANFYQVDTKAMKRGPGLVSRVLELIQKKEALYLEEFETLRCGNVWRELQERRPFTEKNMLEWVADAERTNPSCALDQPATFELRDALECDNLHLGEYPSNRFLESPTIRAGGAAAGLGQSSFDISTTAGTVFPLRLGEFAAYTLVYHHTGGPRTYTVVKPSSHARLEKFICLAFQNQRENPKPPTCSQFISHEEIYIPHSTLEAQGIDFTTVTLFEKEMLIIFPWSYYQGFNTAVNVVEEIMYASKEWERFHRAGCYVKCNKDCVEGEEEFDLGFAERVEDEDHDIRQPASKRRCTEVQDGAV